MKRIVPAVKHASVLSLFCLVLLVAFETQAMNPDSEWSVDLRPGLSWVRTDTKDYGGFSLGASGGWRFWNQANLELNVQYAGFGVQDYNQIHILDTTLGLSYEIDRLPIVPTFGLGIGPYFSNHPETYTPTIPLKNGEEAETSIEAKTRNKWRTDVGVMTRFSLHYFITEQWALGGEARYHYVITNFPNTPIFLDLAFKAQYEF